MENIKESLDTISKKLSEEHNIPYHAAQWFAYEICSKTLKEVKDVVKAKATFQVCEEPVAEELITTFKDCEFQVMELCQEVTDQYSGVADDFFRHNY